MSVLYTDPYDEDLIAELRRRQGLGARYDAENAPKKELRWARSGTAYFLRKLNELKDEDFQGETLLPGWSRAELLAHVGYNARALTRLTEWARTGEEHLMYATPTQRGDEIKMGSTLPAIALRHLIEHSVVHLNVEWRDLKDEDWDAQVVTAQGRTVPTRETAWMRTREVWVHAVDLNNFGSFLDFPPDLIDELIADVQRAWARRDEKADLTLVLTDRPEPIVIGEGTVTVTGKAADVCRWLTGRGARRLVASSGDLPEIPRWF